MRYVDGEIRGYEEYEERIHFFKIFSKPIEPFHENYKDEPITYYDKALNGFELSRRLDELRKPERDLSVEQFQQEGLRLINDKLLNALCAIVKSMKTKKTKARLPLVYIGKVYYNYSITLRTEGVYLKVYKMINETKLKKKEREDRIKDRIEMLRKSRAGYGLTENEEREYYNLLTYGGKSYY